MPTDAANAQPQATGLHTGTVLSRDIACLTGGFRVYRLQSGHWSLEPFLSDEGLGARVIPKDLAVGQIARQAGIGVVGFDQVTHSSPVLPNRLWRPFFAPPGPKVPPADAWSMITTQAYKADNIPFARLARSISISLRAAGMHLRSACDQYHLQLCDALLSKQTVGHRFSNIALTDLHLAFHSLLAEMASARDYLAKFAAIRVRASDNIDALNRLQKWLRSLAGSSALKDPLVDALLQAADQNASDRWLWDIGEYRNLFLHRQPLGANDNARFLTLVETATQLGSVRKITMQIEIHSGATTTCDALERFADLHDRLCRLADLAATLAPYPVQPIEIKISEKS